MAHPKVDDSKSRGKLSKGKNRQRRRRKRRRRRRKKIDGGR